MPSPINELRDGLNGKTNGDLQRYFPGGRENNRELS
jgi:hypothetical protein